MLRELAICLGARIPVYLQGLPGVGKTSVANALGEYLKRKVIVITATGLEDFYTVRHTRRLRKQTAQKLRDDASAAVYVSKYAWNEAIVYALENPNDVIVVVDELNARGLMEAFQKLAVPGTDSCGLYIPRELMIICTGNPGNIATSGCELTSVLANRFCVLIVKMAPAFESLASWFRTGQHLSETFFSNITVDPPIIEWSQLSSRVKEAAARLCDNLAGSCPEFKDDELVNTTPRTVRYLAFAAESAMRVGVSWDSEEFANVARGLVHENTADMFIRLLTNIRVVSFDDLLNCTENELRVIPQSTVTAVVGQYRPELYITVSRSPKAITVDERVKHLIQSLIKHDMKESAAKIANDTVVYVMSKLRADAGVWRDLSMHDWADRQVYLEACDADTE